MELRECSRRLGRLREPQAVACSTPPYSLAGSSRGRRTLALSPGAMMGDEPMGVSVPYVTNGLDGMQVYFEDDDGDGIPVGSSEDSSIRSARYGTLRSQERCRTPPMSFGSSSSIIEATVAATSHTTRVRTRCRCVSGCRGGAR